MTTNDQVPSGERLLRLLQHLGIERAHFAAGPFAIQDCAELVAAHPGVVASLTLVGAPNPVAFRPLAARLLVVGGDSGPAGRGPLGLAASVPGARGVTLVGYAHTGWSDVAADRPQELGGALRAFLADVSREHGPPGLALPAQEGEVAGIAYRLQGAGPPLVLLPLGLAPAQWEPLLPALGRDYATLVLGGPVLRPAGLLERRGAAAGFRRVVGTLVDAVALRPGERLLDVGCGTGVLDRWLVRRTAGANPIVAVDVNRYLLREAEALARKEHLPGGIEFREGDAAALPFPDGAFDATLAVTVLEEVDADRALAELVRVTRPGGRVGVLVRGTEDLPQWVNAPLRAALKAKVEAPGAPPRDAGKAADGCADASLYRRVRAAGLVGVQMFPQLYGYDSGPFLADLEAGIRGALSPDEAREWQAAVAQAEAEGTFCIARPCHCAVGTKP